MAVNDDRYVGHWEPAGSCGNSRVWVREKIVPRIADHFLSCSFYVYDSVKAAEKGERFGGSGFLVSVPSEHEGWIHVYAVTNKHVLDKGNHVLRLNTRDGKSESMVTSPESWIHHPDGDDIAVSPIDLDSERIRWWAVSTDSFLTREIEQDYIIGPGDETFLVGRLVTLEGRQRNTPVARFGNISMSPEEPIKCEDGKDREAFLVECRSLSGFSGSPVFVNAKRSFSNLDMPRDIKANQEEGAKASTVKVSVNHLSGTFGPWLLGVDFSHMPLWKPVFEADRKTMAKQFVDANTGIACVVPAWRLLTLLQDEDLVKQRKKEDEEISKRKNSPSAAVFDVEERSESEFTQDDFVDALKKASKRIDKT